MDIEPRPPTSRIRCGLLVVIGGPETIHLTNGLSSTIFNSSSDMPFGTVLKDQYTMPYRARDHLQWLYERRGKTFHVRIGCRST